MVVPAPAAGGPQLAQVCVPILIRIGSNRLQHSPSHCPVLPSCLLCRFCDEEEPPLPRNIAADAYRDVHVWSAL